MVFFPASPEAIPSRQPGPPHQSQVRGWEQLPFDVQRSIAGRLGIRDLAALGQVNRQARKVTGNEFWRQVWLREQAQGRFPRKTPENIESWKRECLRTLAALEKALARDAVDAGRARSQAWQEHGDGVSAPLALLAAVPLVEAFGSAVVREVGFQWRVLGGISMAMLPEPQRRALHSMGLRGPGSVTCHYRSILSIVLPGVMPLFMVGAACSGWKSLVRSVEDWGWFDHRPDDKDAFHLQTFLERGLVPKVGSDGEGAKPPPGERV